MKRFVLYALFVLAMLSPPAQAQQSLSAAEFEAYTTGKTLFYGRDGAAYGAEEYLDNRRVRWSFLDGKCKDGRWYEEQGQICFVYEDNPDPQCWTFEQGTTGLIARFQGLSSGTDVYEAQDSDEEMLCLGPEVGV